MNVFEYINNLNINIFGGIKLLIIRINSFNVNIWLN